MHRTLVMVMVVIGVAVMILLVVGVAFCCRSCWSTPTGLAPLRRGWGVRPPHAQDARLPEVLVQRLHIVDVLHRLMTSLVAAERDRTSFFSSCLQLFSFKWDGDEERKCEDSLFISI